MRRKWEELEEFPNYAVSSLGEFVNMRTDRTVNTSKNQQGHAKITLYKNKMLVTRSAAQLVANTFLERPYPHWDTPIHLDGDLMNCEVDNLMWRPRWYAVRYHRQFMYPTFHEDFGVRVDVKTGEKYHGLKDLCTKNGLYYHDVVEACNHETFVPLTYQEFRNAS